MLDVLAIVIIVAFFIGCAAFVRGSARIIGEGRSGDEVHGEVGPSDEGRAIGGCRGAGAAMLVERRSDEGAIPGGAVTREPADTGSAPVAERREGEG
jgi:hypothetical protein